MKLIPFGNKLLVKRRRVGDKLGSEGIIIAADETKERPTDLADVQYVPDNSFADQSLIENSEDIVKAITDKAKGGDSDALIALLRFNEYLKIKSIQPGDCVMISKYVGTDFHDNQGGGYMTLVNGEDIIGVVR